MDTITNRMEWAARFEACGGCGETNRLFASVADNVQKCLECCTAGEYYSR